MPDAAGGAADTPRLPLSAPKVVALRAGYFSAEERAEMLDFYRGGRDAPLRDTFGYVIGTARTGRYWRSEAEALAALRIGHGTYYRHLRRLLDDVWLVQTRRAARHRGTAGVTAEYRVLRPGERFGWLGDAIRAAAEVTCPCGAGCPTLAGCPGWVRPVQGNLGV